MMKDGPSADGVFFMFVVDVSADLLVFDDFFLIFDDFADEVEVF